MMDQTEIKEIQERLGNNIHQFSGQTILITGCCGFLGKIFSHFFLHLNQFLDEPCKVIGVDNFIIGLPSLDINDPNFTFINHDICLPLDEKVEGCIDYVVNCAGIADPAVYTRLNKATLDGAYFGSFNILELAKDRAAKSVIMFSSSEVIGGFQDDDMFPTPETETCCFPMKGERSSYDCSKLLSIVISDIYFRHHKLNVKNILPFNVYSSNMSLKDKRVIPSFINKVLSGQPIEIYGDGGDTRSFCHGVDFIYGALLVLLKGKANQHYNIGNPDEITMLELADLIVSIIGYGEIKLVEPPKVYKKQPRRRVPDIKLARKKLGFWPKISLEEGITRYWNFVNLNK